MQKQTYQNLIRNRAQFQSVTGYSPDFFDALFLHFKVQWDTYITRYIAYKNTIKNSDKIMTTQLAKPKGL